MRHRLIQHDAEPSVAQVDAATSAEHQCGVLIRLGMTEDVPCVAPAAGRSFTPRSGSRHPKKWH